MKLKDIFKIAVVGAAGWAGGQIAGPIGKKIGEYKWEYLVVQEVQ